MYVGKIEAKTIAHLHEYILSVIGQNIYSNTNGDTVIDLLYTDEIRNRQGYQIPVKALVTDALNAVRAQRDNNHLVLSDYIHDIDQLLYHPDQLRITTGTDIVNKELGKVLTINNVNNAECDHYNQPIHNYIKSIKQFEPDTFTINTGEQVFYNTEEGKTITINKVQEATNAINDQYGNNIANSYSNINHSHTINDISNIQQYIDNTIINTIEQLLAEGKIKVINNNSIEYNQYPKYDFEDNESILITLPINTKYNRPAPEVLKLKNEQVHWSSFTYSFNIYNYSINVFPSLIKSNCINDEGKLITNKTIDFGSPRQLNEGYISYSGIITNDNINTINNIIVK